MRYVDRILNKKDLLFLNVYTLNFLLLRILLLFWFEGDFSDIWSDAEGVEKITSGMTVTTAIF